MLNGPKEVRNAAVCRSALAEWALIKDLLEKHTNLSTASQIHGNERRRLPVVWSAAGCLARRDADAFHAP
jgi:hypothetical protein